MERIGLQNRESGFDSCTSRHASVVSMVSKAGSYPVGRGSSPRGSTMKTCEVCGKPVSSKRFTYCSVSCFQKVKYLDNVARWLRGELTGIRGQRSFALCEYVRKYMLEKHNYACEKCGWNERHPVTGEVPLEVHHRDGNFFNTVEDNLELLCPNCHALTETYRARNKGNGRARKI